MVKFSDGAKEYTNPLLRGYDHDKRKNYPTIQRLQGPYRAGYKTCSVLQGRGGGLGRISVIEFHDDLLYLPIGDEQRAMGRYPRM